ncbi:AIM24 family protein [Methanobrevibacter arboriphilus]|uniref:AIM24 family protein n=1 Tax=Methanobrevibacter arboriphilus TaxID=39441 RepID=UPI00373FD166
MLFFLNFFTAEEDDQEIGFANSFPGKIIPIELDGNKTIIAQKKCLSSIRKGC